MSMDNLHRLLCARAPCEVLALAGCWHQYCGLDLFEKRLSASASVE